MKTLLVPFLSGIKFLKPPTLTILKEFCLNLVDSVLNKLISVALT